MRRSRSNTPLQALITLNETLFVASHLELFDYKPQLEKFDGTLPPPELIQDYRAAFINPNSKLMGPKFKFSQHGQSGAQVSELLPHLSQVVDDIAIVRSMSTDAFNHAPGQILMSTGSQQFGRPSLGAWVTYGLGSEAEDLPSFVVFSSGKKGPSGGDSNWGSGFLPTVYQGVQFRSSGAPVLYLSNPQGLDREAQGDAIRIIRRLNEMRLRSVGDPEIATRINSFEMAFRMQTSVPELMDIGQEPQSILDLYGAQPGGSSFANNCLLARRLVQRGVRFVQLFHEAWDQHSDLTEQIQENCRVTDQACAALLTDLKQQGMLEETLVIWGGASSDEHPWYRATKGTVATTIPTPSPCGWPVEASNQGSHWEKPTNSDSTWWPTGYTSTTCRPPSCICSVSTTPG